MIQTSQIYKSFISQYTRTSDARIYFGMYDVTAKSDATINAEDKQSFINVNSLIDEKRKPALNVATFEDGHFKLDGSFCLMPDDLGPEDNIGWWSQSMSDAAGNFEVPPTIDFVFASKHSSLGLGLYFDSASGAYCTDFDIFWYSNGDLLDSANVRDNTRVDYNIEKPVENYDKVTIAFLKTNKPYRYARLFEVNFGLEETFDSDDIIRASVIEEVDPSMATLSINKLKFTVLNENQRFNMLNPDSVYAFLQRRQKLTAQSGIMVGDNVFEYIPLGEFYLYNWENSTGLTATLEATDIFGLLDKTTYYRSPFWQNEPVESVLRHIFDDAIKLPARVELIINPEVASERVTGYIPIVSHREAIHMVLLASRAAIRSNRLEALEVFRPSYDSAIAKVGFDNMLGAQKIAQKPLITGVEVKDFNYIKNAEAIQLHNSVVDINGTYMLDIPYDKTPAYDCGISIAGAGAIIGTPEFSATSARLQLTGNGQVTITITGKAYSETSMVVRSERSTGAGEVSQYARVAENKLISGNGSVIAQYLLDYYQKRVKQGFRAWINPSMQAGDCIEVDTIFGQPQTGIIERQEIRFSPALQGEVEVVG